MEFSHLYEIMQNLREIFDMVRLVDTDRMEICLSLSIGGYYRGNRLEDPIEAADQKMYQAKKKKDCVVI